jgi:hypothetical protein
MKQTFELRADETLDACKALYAQRGAQYQDSWDLKHAVFVASKATLAAIGVTLTDEQIRMLQAASLVDVKASRLGGKWNEDSVKDGINYQAVWCSFMNEYVKNNETCANMAKKDFLPGTTSLYRGSRSCISAEPCPPDPSTV